MKAMLTGFATIAVISIGAYFVLHEIGFSAAEQNSSQGVRLD
ncbi:hypothetical protein [Nereida sp. MMG025]|nr:hypothetical protein [Nereida sp. MMG025]